MKHFLSIVFLTLVLVTVGSQNNQAEAYRYHVGVLYDGREVFLLTDTFRGSYDNFECVAVAAGSYDEEIYYSFWRGEGGMYYRNSLRRQTRLVRSSNIATNILNYFRR